MHMFVPWQRTEWSSLSLARQLIRTPAKTSSPGEPEPWLLIRRHRMGSFVMYALCKRIKNSLLYYTVQKTNAALLCFENMGCAPVGSSLGLDEIINQIIKQQQVERCCDEVSQLSVWIQPQQAMSNMCLLICIVYNAVHTCGKLFRYVPHSDLGRHEIENKLN